MWGRTGEVGENHVEQSLIGELKTFICILSARRSQAWLYVEHSNEYSGYTGKDR